MYKTNYVILCNLGGPNKKEETQFFLFNLFNDKYIIPLPFPVRFALAKIISFFRHKKSQEEYDKMGGFSPILQNTQAQAAALEATLGGNYKVLVSMRYNHPFIKDVLKSINRNNVEKIIFLPLYPQFSITTNKSAIEEFQKITSKLNLHNVVSIPCFYNNPLYVESCSRSILKELHAFQNKEAKIIVLFSAHGIPEDFITKFHDTYQTHIEATAKLITERLHKETEISFVTKICYQSRVGPKQWLKPYIQTVIPNYSGQNMVVFPIAFVSEHLETLVELDHQYHELANDCKILEYRRAQTSGTCPIFIQALKEICEKHT
jgi:ferrochelatase